MKFRYSESPDGVMSEEIIKKYMKNMIEALVYSKDLILLKGNSSFKGSSAQRYQTLEYIDYQR